MALYTLRSNLWLTIGGVFALILILITLASSSTGTRSLLSHATQSLRHDPLSSIQNSTLGVRSSLSAAYLMLTILQFQKIYVINLPSRTDHRDAISLSAALTGLEVEYRDGVKEVALKALPPGNADNKLNPAELGNWRAHMNIAQHMVENKIASALIMEDDIDWDIRIKDQMQDFAKASRMLVQPLAGTDNTFLDPTCPRPGPDDVFTNFYVDNNSRTSKPVSSPYGDLERWDLLWLGHCGGYFPSADKVDRPLGRAVILDDQTVPEPQHIGMLFADGSLQKQYPPHTRVVTRSYQNICTFAYALSLPGAERLLYEMGVHNLTDHTDIAWRQFCQEPNRPQRNCLSVQPPLFQDHRPIGKSASFSDIGFHGDGVNEHAFTRNIRWSTRLNLARLLEGEKDYIDLYQDGEAATDWGYGK